MLNLENWKNTVLKRYQAKYKPSLSEVEHILDFLDKNPKTKLHSRVSYLSIRLKAEAWVKYLNEKNKNLKESGEVEVLHTFPNGFIFVRLVDQVAKDWEGKNMGHCVSSYAKHEGIYSLRDQGGFPHCTIESLSGTIRQIKGKSNKPVVREYQRLVGQCLGILNHKIATQDIERLNYQPVSSDLRSVLIEHFKDVEIINFQEHSYFFVGKDCTLEKPFTEYNQKVFEFIFCHFLSLEGFKQLLALSQKSRFYVSNVREAVTRTCKAGRLDFFKAVEEHYEFMDALFLYNPQYITFAMESGSNELLIYLLTKSKNLRKRKIEANPDFVYTSVGEVDFGELLSSALYQKNISLAEQLIKLGAKVEPKQLTKVLGLGIEFRSDFLTKVGLSALDGHRGTDFAAVIYKLWQRQDLEQFTSLISSFYKPSFLVNCLYVLAIRQKDNQLLNWLCEAYPRNCYEVIKNNLSLLSKEEFILLDSKGSRGEFKVEELLRSSGSFIELDIVAELIKDKRIVNYADAKIDASAAREFVSAFSNLIPLGEELEAQLEDIIIMLCRAKASEALEKVSGAWRLKLEARDHEAWKICLRNNNIKCIRALKQITTKEELRNMKIKDLRIRFLGESGIVDEE